MTITHEITLDFASIDQPARIFVKQGDTFTRQVAITLLADGEPWEVPEDAAVLIRYLSYVSLEAVDGRGIYDTLPDGTSAWSASGNVVTITLVPEMLARESIVWTDVVFTREDKILATGNFEIYVNQTPAKGTEAEAQSYYRVASLDTLNDWIGRTEAEMELINSRKLEKTGDSMTGDLDMGGCRVRNLGEPEADTDAVTKGLLEQTAALAGSAVLLADWTLTGTASYMLAQLDPSIRYSHLMVRCTLMGSSENPGSMPLELVVDGEDELEAGVVAAWLGDGVGTVGDVPTWSDFVVFPGGFSLAVRHSDDPENMEPQQAVNFCRHDAVLGSTVSNIRVQVKDWAGCFGPGSRITVTGIRA